MIAMPEIPTTTRKFGTLEGQPQKSRGAASTAPGTTLQIGPVMPHNDTPNDNSILRPESLRDMYDELGLDPKDGLSEYGFRRVAEFQDDAVAWYDMLVSDLGTMIRDIDAENPSGGISMNLLAWITVVTPGISKWTVLEALGRIGFDSAADGSGKVDAGKWFDASKDDLFALVRRLEVHRLRAMPYKDYLQSAHWQDVRRIALESAGHRCRLCNAESSLHVHHRTYERRGEELPEDVIALCEKCHQVFHDKLAVEPSQSKKSAYKQTKKHVPDPDKISSLPEFKKFDKVHHPKFGKGLVVSVTNAGQSGDKHLEVSFNDHGHKRLLASLAGLEIVSSSEALA